jgi:hypothetical protein
MTLRNHISLGVADKKRSSCSIEIARKKMHRLAEVGVPLSSEFFKRIDLSKYPKSAL